MSDIAALQSLEEDVCYLSALELAAAYRARSLTPSEVTDAVLCRSSASIRPSTRLLR